MSTIKLAQSIKVSFASRLLKNYAEHQRHKKTLPILLGALGLTSAGAAGKTLNDINSEVANSLLMSSIKNNRLREDLMYNAAADIKNALSNGNISIKFNP